VWVPPWERRSLRIARMALQALVIGSVLYSLVKGNWDMMRQQNGSQSAKSPLNGIWSSNEADSTSTWQTVVFEPGWLSVRLADRSTVYLKAKYEQDKRCFQVKNALTGTEGTVCVQQPDTTNLRIEGMIGKKPVVAALHRIERNTFLLTSRGFHWISEDPFNQ
jgi:hypothetical protein